MINFCLSRLKTIVIDDILACLFSGRERKSEEGEGRAVEEGKRKKIQKKYFVPRSLCSSLSSHDFSVEDVREKRGLSFATSAAEVAEETLFLSQPNS